MKKNEITQYIAELNRSYREGNATEHTYRPALQRLLEKLTSEVTITNEPKRIACGAPDYIVTRKEIPVGYIEAKDIGENLNDKKHKTQFDRYKRSLHNLIITDYLTFQLFENGGIVMSVTIAKTDKNNVIADATQFNAFTTLVSRFTDYNEQGICTSVHLSKVMAAKARLMANIIENALSGEEQEGDNSLDFQVKGFREVLIPDINYKEFSDIYAQTIAYGMFTACLNDTLDTKFTRSKAAQLIPHSNPFLRKFFQYVAGNDLDERICWVVEDLADLFNHVNVTEIINEFGKNEHDPIIHFYETFLAEYDPALRKSRGVWYTPQPVVQFIVQAVDDILKQDFRLSKGLADESKTKIKEKKYHKVQILDPATGTGTFLAEVVQNIYERYKNQKGMWQSYVIEHLIPRINGFEILMASYAMAHLKLDMVLQQNTDYKTSDSKRLRIYLTNSLEEARTKSEILFAKWLSDEANEANSIKQDAPVMVVLGNPPYNVSSQNKNDWIDGLIAEYKQGLNEKKLNLDDDYIKFIRYGQHYIQKNGGGILAYISNNSFIDGVTHRQMRKSLATTFDKIYILNLHGSSKKKETAPDGKSDGNVFDIQQGVSINIFIKTTDKNELAKIYYCDLFGSREEKYRFLSERRLSSLEWHELSPTTPYYFFVPKNFEKQHEYKKGFSITEIFTVYNNAIKTDRDALFVDMDKETLERRIQRLLSGNYDEKFVETYRVFDSGSYKLTKSISKKQFDKNNVKTIQYRFFDYRYIYYKPGLTSRPAFKVMKHLNPENVSLLTCRQQSSSDFRHIFVSKLFSEVCTVSLQTKETTYVFPLYLYPEFNNLFADEPRKSNLDETIVSEISQRIGLRFTEEKEESRKTFAPIDVLDYIYAVLHSPAYREKYKEFLKIDFPRVPYPENAKIFRALIALGAKLRRLHLMEDIEPKEGVADYPVSGSNVIEKPEYKSGNVWINDRQFFGHVPLAAWNFYIGGYQPAQKWLKDRKEKTLGYDEIQHYRTIIRVLMETEDVMRALTVIEK